MLDTGLLASPMEAAMVLEGTNRLGLLARRPAGGVMITGSSSALLAMARSSAANRRADGESRPPSSISCSVSGTSLVASAVLAVTSVVLAVEAGAVLLRLLNDGEARFGASNSCSGSNRCPSRPRIATYDPSASDCDGVPVFESGTDVDGELMESTVRAEL